MLNNQTKIVRKNLPWQELDEKIVILSPDTLMSHELNESLSWIWKKIEVETSFSNLLNDLVETFDINVDEAMSDLDEILIELKDRSLIEINE